MVNHLERSWLILLAFSTVFGIFLFRFFIKGFGFIFDLVAQAQPLRSNIAEIMGSARYFGFMEFLWYIIGRK